MGWSIRGTFVETCSCNMLCPCWYAVPELMVMDQGWCSTALLVRIDEGDVDGVDLSNTDVVMGLHFPGPTLFDGNATARIYLDESTTPEQREALESIFKGERGGAMAVTAGLTSTWLDTVVGPVEVSEEGDVVNATVGSTGKIRSERLRNEGGDVMTMEGTGFSLALEFDDARAELAPSAGTEWSDPDLPVNFSNKSGAVGKINWSGD